MEASMRHDPYDLIENAVSSRRTLSVPGPILCTRHLHHARDHVPLCLFGKASGTTAP
jgi:hypothetical protein